MVLLCVQGHLARIAESDDLGRLGLSRVPPPPRSCEVRGKLSQCVHFANCTSCRSNAMNKFLTRLGQVAGRLVGAGCLPRTRACPKAHSSPALLVLQAMVTQQEVHVSWAPSCVITSAPLSARFRMRISCLWCAAGPLNAPVCTTQVHMLPVPCSRRRTRSTTTVLSCVGNCTVSTLKREVVHFELVSHSELEVSRYQHLTSRKHRDGFRPSSLGLRCTPSL